MTEPLCQVHFKDNQVILDDGKGLVTKLPIEMLEGIVLIGTANLTTGCQRELLIRGISVTYLASNGQYYGRLESTRHVNIIRQRTQFRLGDDPAFVLAFSQKIIAAKINNQIVLLRRYNRDKKYESIVKIINDMQLLQKKLDTTTSVNQILGYEGNCARLYFGGLAKLVRADFAFHGRNKMPPKDPFNSLLSFGYTLLLYEVYGALTNKGLHPYAGLMHQDRNGHPALASDLMEEWRAVLIDAMVMNMLNNAVFTKDDFDYDALSGGVYLGHQSLKIFLQAYEKKVRVQAHYLSSNESMSFKQAIQYQVNALAKAIEGRDLTYYQPVRIR